MEEQLEPPAEEIKRLQRCLNDLVGVLALPAIWIGGEPSRIAQTLLDVLLGMLHLDFIYARLPSGADEAPVEMVRTAPARDLPAGPREIGEMLDGCLGEDPQKWPPSIRYAMGDGDLSLVPLRLGLQGEIGFLVAGSRRAYFPGQTERLLLSVAANQAAIGLQEAWLRSEQKRVANELDQRVAQRTAELAAVNEQLKKEIAERRLAEEKLRQEEETLGELRSELARVARVTSLGALTASIAHEVNQPLSGIVTNASTCLRMLAADPPNVDGARETAKRTIRDGHRASEVIARLRALFSKKGATTEAVDLNEATREVIALSRSEIQKSRVVLRLELADILPPVTGDRVQLQQVIFNLLLNASDAMIDVDDRPRQLVIRTERAESNHVRLAVRDAGVGFEPLGADRLFAPFYTTKDGGMGIGLSVSRSIIESHQGRLWATPNDGPGATFSFSLPCRPESLTPAGSVSALGSPAVKDAGCVLETP